MATMLNVLPQGFACADLPESRDPYCPFFIYFLAVNCILTSSCYAIVERLLQRGLTMLGGVHGRPRMRSMIAESFGLGRSQIGVEGPVTFAM